MDSRAESARKLLQVEEEVSQILTKEFALETENEGYKVAAILAIQVCLKLLNVLRAVKNPDAGLGAKMAMDLTVSLNSNSFWKIHGATLMPLLHVALHAQLEYAVLSIQKQDDNRRSSYDDLIVECKYVGLEMFSMVAFCLGGEDLLLRASMNIKKQLSPYLD